MAFIYDYERLTPEQVKHAYTNEINEYKRKEHALKNLLNKFDESLYIDKDKLNKLRERLCEIRLHISNLETEMNILTL